MKKLALLFCFIGSAQAATTNLTVSGTISTSCVFGSTTAGTFGYTPSAPSVLSTAASGGNAAQVIVSYSGTPTITVTEPTSFTSTPNGYNGTPSFSSAVTSGNGGSMSYSSGVASYTESSGSSDVITLNMAATNNNGNAFPLGTYTSTSTVTCQQSWFAPITT